MPRILTVDDSRAIRSIVSKQLVEMGFEVDEAEDGEQGLSHLEECPVDLVLLDVTMPVLDGPGMLAKMRERGDKTPVLMLTSESKKSVVASVMKLGIADYILKPFKAPDLAAKIAKVLGTPLPATNDAPAATPSAPPPPRPAEAAVDATPAGGVARKFNDILVIDDMENVYRKLRGMIPAHFTISHCVSAQQALALCRESIFRLVLLDSEMPDVSSTVLQKQIRTLQPQAPVLAMFLRTTNDIDVKIRTEHWDGVLLKPFDAASVEDLLAQYFDNQELVLLDDNVLKIAPFAGKEDRQERYFQRVGGLVEGLLEKLAAACFDQAILDLSRLPGAPNRTPKLVLKVGQRAEMLGIELRLVGTQETQQLLSNFTDTAAISFYSSIAEARAA